MPATEERPPNPAHSRIGFTEFVVLAAATMSTQAIAIDAMLPAFPVIVQSLKIADPNRGQLIVTAYMAGLGVGQLFWGLMSDRFGRRRMLLGGLSLYVAAALLCSLAGSFSALLAWRFVHGLAAASVTVVRSVIRDLYSGRHMARVLSLTFVVFLMVPIIAPSIGQIILMVAPWRFIFALIGAFTAAVALWVFIRLPETLHPEYRLTLTRKHLGGAVARVLGERISLCYTLAMTVMYASIMAYVGSVQQIFAVVFRSASLMPGMFALCALFMGVAAFMNSRIVERFGMRVISHTALLAFIAITALHSLLAALGMEQLWTFVAFQSVTMACFGMAVSNFGAMAMEPVGSVAGIAASLQGFVSTLFGAVLGGFIGREFNGTTLPLTAGCLACGIAALGFVLLAERGRLFKAQHSGDSLSVGAPIESAGMH
jgi:DHA1 family bicyclomycin/chloramphenicol resistance-like MFS transporter